jgi:predicted lipoprotein with Yx(FWY)xxD motif
MNHARTNPASAAALVVTLAIAGVAAACTTGASAPSPTASSAPSTAVQTASPTTAATAAPTASPTAAPTAAPTAKPASNTVKIGVATSAKLGSYLTGPNGRTLYTLSSDPNDKSTCAGDCATAWPPLKIASNGKVESTAMATFGSIKRADGTDQVALDGHPLYEFIMDTAAGQTKGEGIKAFGGTWHVAKAS